MADADYTNEKWLPVPGYEGLYEVSDHGRVKSLPRVVERAHGVPLPVHGRILATRHPSLTYPALHLGKPGEIKLWKVHHLVMLAFVGPLPEGLVTRHLNGNPKDNRLSNLSYGTQAENVRDSVNHGTNYIYNVQSTKTHCPRGHLLVEPNLIVSALPTRKCKACKRAVNARNWNPEVDKDAAADKAYRKIMGEAA